MDFHLAALWFLVGATANYLISKILGLYYGVILFQEIEKFVAVYTTTLVKGVRVLLLRRFELLKESDTMTDEELNKIKQTDVVTIFLFKEMVMYNMRKSCPKYYIPYLKYSNWEELEEYAAEETRE